MKPTQASTGVRDTEWWQRGPVDGVPAPLQPVAHILLQVRESVDDMVGGMTEAEWNSRPGGVASPAFHLRHIPGVIDRLFTYARGHTLSAEQLASIPLEGAHLAPAEVAGALESLSKRVDAAVAELKTIDVTTLGDFRGVGRKQLPSTVIGCLVHGAEHAMRHVGQLSVTIRVIRSQTEVLQAFADAWNRHDIDALMSFMTGDCVFESSAGPDVCGTRYVGADAVRAGYLEVFATFPDAQWRNPRHFMHGDRGVSEWTFTGTRADGTRVEVNGCDLLLFRDGKIALKNSYRKNRSAPSRP